MLLTRLRPGLQVWQTAAVVQVAHPVVRQIRSQVVWSEDLRYPLAQVPQVEEEAQILQLLMLQAALQVVAPVPVTKPVEQVWQVVLVAQKMQFVIPQEGSHTFVELL